jgi:hypothetical protein
MMKVMVWYSVNDTHKVMTALILWCLFCLARIDTTASFEVFLWSFLCNLIEMSWGSSWFSLHSDFMRNASSRWADSFVTFFVQGCYVCIVTGYCEGGDMWVYNWLTCELYSCFALSKPSHKTVPYFLKAVLHKDWAKELIRWSNLKHYMLAIGILHQDLGPNQELYECLLHNSIC